jgi:hypothetical protein
VGFFLFILVNATLFLRPGDVLPDLHGWHIYEFLILACLAVSFPRVLDQFQQRALENRPITLCVLGLLVAVVLSHLTQLDLERAGESGQEFAKVVIYYLLLVSLIDTPARLRQFLLWLTGFIVVLTLVAVLRYHGVVEISPPILSAKATEKDIENFKKAFVEDRIVNPLTGEETVINRLRGTGVFQDPNDLCLIVVAGILLSLCWFSDPRLGSMRVLWTASIVLLGYALFLTQSRGGFLCLSAGLLALLCASFGWRRSVPLGLGLLAALLVVFAGRMTSISAGEGTGQSRIQIWSDGLVAFQQAPFFGNGMDKYGERAAHNSFINCFTELGLLGGILFVGMFYLALWTLYRYNQARAGIYLPDQRRLAPFLLALVAGYGVGLLALSQSYTVPTYLILGLATVYAGVTVVYPPLPSLRLDSRLVQRLAVVGIGFLAASYLFVRVFMVRA